MTCTRSCRRSRGYVGVKRISNRGVDIHPAWNREEPSDRRWPAGASGTGSRRCCATARSSRATSGHGTHGARATWSRFRRAPTGSAGSRTWLSQRRDVSRARRGWRMTARDSRGGVCVSEERGTPRYRRHYQDWTRRGSPACLKEHRLSSSPRSASRCGSKPFTIREATETRRKQPRSGSPPVGISSGRDLPGSPRSGSPPRDDHRPSSADTRAASSPIATISTWLSLRSFHSILPSAKPRLPTAIRIGMPIRSASLNFTPGRSSRSS
jgi:hypothetical protein